MSINEKIQKLLDNSILFTAEQKAAWLDLLPKMNEEESSELYGILADEIKELKKEGIDLINDSKLEAELVGESSAAHGASLEKLKSAIGAQQSPSSINFAQELKKEVNTPELRKPTPEELGQKAPVAAKSHGSIAADFAPFPKELSTPMAPKRAAPQVKEPSPTTGLKNLIDIRAVDDLKKVQTAHLRQGELGAQISMIRAKILSIAQADKILPFYTVNAFEQSPLYKTYLAIGAAMIADTNPDRSEAFGKATAQLGDEKLTLREFEAIADLRKQIEQL